MVFQGVFFDAQAAHDFLCAVSGEDFWFDGEFNRLDEYQGYELNLVLPRNIETIPMTMIGGMMQRAACGDNYEAELPVVSVVIPESYTDILYYTFAINGQTGKLTCDVPADKKKSLA